MKVARYGWNGREHVGVVEGDTVVPARTGVLELLTAPKSFVAAGEPVPLAEVRLLPPLEPPSIRDFVTFEQHVEGS